MPVQWNEIRSDEMRLTRGQIYVRLVKRWCTQSKDAEVLSSILRSYLTKMTGVQLCFALFPVRSLPPYIPGYWRSHGVQHSACYCQPWTRKRRSPHRNYSFIRRNRKSKAKAMQWYIFTQSDRDLTCLMQHLSLIEFAFLRVLPHMCISIYPTHNNSPSQFSHLTPLYPTQSRLDRTTPKVLNHSQSHLQDATGQVNSLCPCKTNK